MAAGSFTLYHSAKKDILDGTIDLDTNTIKAILVTSSYTPSTAHDTYSDVSATECGNSDYSAQTLAGKAFTESGGTVKYDSTDVTYGTSVSITAKYLILVKQSGGSLAASDKLVGYVDLDTGGGSATSTSSDYIVRWNANGIFTMA